MANKLLPCICGGNGITVDAEPPKEERESWEKHGFEPPRHYAVRCDKCGKQTKPYKLKTPAWKEWNRLNREKCKYNLYNEILISAEKGANNDAQKADKK